MDKTAAGLLGAVAGMATLGSAQASADPARGISEALQASSYADLLKPIPDALALMRADEAGRAQKEQANAPGSVQTAQAYYYGYGNPYGAPYPPYAAPYPPYGAPYGYHPRYYHHHHYHHHHHHHHHGFYGYR